MGVMLMDSKKINDRNSINNHINADADTDINTISTTNQVKEKLVDKSKHSDDNKNLKKSGNAIDRNPNYPADSDNDF
jgi:hypothetical protein